MNLSHLWIKLSSKMYYFCFIVCNEAEINDRRNLFYIMPNASRLILSEEKHIICISSVKTFSWIYSHSWIVFHKNIEPHASIVCSIISKKKKRRVTYFSWENFHCKASTASYFRNVMMLTITIWRNSQWKKGVGTYSGRSSTVSFIKLCHFIVLF